MNIYINEFKEGLHFEGELLVTNVLKGVSNNGAPYLSITLQDRTGSIEAKKWDSSEADSATAVIGNVIHVSSDVIEYRGSLQMKIISLSSFDQGNVDYTRFSLESPIAQEELLRKFNRYLSSIQNEDCKKIINYILERHYDEFICYPAAVKNHHEFASGLLFHTVSMLDLASAIQNLYNDVDRDLLLTGVILHDIGKTIELSGPVATKYTLEGKLLGHITIMVSEIRFVAEKHNIHSDIPVLLEHMILSHHGEQDFGSPVPPLTREAFILHAVDDLDAKMVMINKALDGVQVGEFSTRVMALDGRAFYKHK